MRLFLVGDMSSGAITQHDLLSLAFWAKPYGLKAKEFDNIANMKEGEFVDICDIRFSVYRVEKKKRKSHEA